MLMAEVRSLHVRTPPRLPVCYKFNVTVSLLMNTVNYLQCLKMRGSVIRRNPPEPQVMSGQKLCAKIVCIVLQLLCDCFKYLPKEIISKKF